MYDIFTLRHKRWVKGRINRFDDFGQIEFEYKINDEIYKWWVHRDNKQEIRYEGTKTNIQQKQIPLGFHCSLTGQLMRNPVVSAKSGYSFEAKEIERYIDQYGVDPKTKIKMDKDDLISNRNLKDDIDVWIKRHPNWKTYPKPQLF